MDHSYKLKNVHYVVQHNRRTKYVSRLKCHRATQLKSKHSHLKVSMNLSTDILHKHCITEQD